MKKIIPFLLLLMAFHGYGQNYNDSLQKFQAEYVKKHEVVAGADKDHLNFFSVNEKYNVTARFEKVLDSKWFSMETSGTMKKTFRVYGVLHFIINDTAVTLNIYQSQNLMNLGEYKGYLFLPFADRSSGEETYAAGRYIDLNTTDIVNNKVMVDFNKAYNPYCAYVSGKYNCPIPPKENQLPVFIAAGEKAFAKSH